MKLAVEKREMPLSPCPEVQPPPTLDPRPMRKPPTTASCGETAVSAAPRANSGYAVATAHAPAAKLAEKRMLLYDGFPFSPPP